METDNIPDQNISFKKRLISSNKVLSQRLMLHDRKDLYVFSGMVPGTFRPPLPQSQASPYASFGPGMPPSPFMDPRTMALYGSMMPQANPFFQPGLDPFRDPYR